METKQLFNYLIKIQSIAKIGLKYSRDPYAISNYNEINDLTMKMLEDFLAIKFDRPNYFLRDLYPTPNISVRTVIFSNKDKNKVLLVREKDEQKYSLPGGWCDLYESASFDAKKECEQEAGANVNIVRLVGLTNRNNGSDKSHLSEYVAIFEGELISPLHEHEYETDDVNFFDIDELPPISRKTNKDELLRFIKAAKENETIFD